MKPKLNSKQKSFHFKYLMSMMLAIFYLSFIEISGVQAVGRGRCTQTSNDNTIGKSQTYKFTFYPASRFGEQSKYQTFINIQQLVIFLFSAFLRIHFTKDSTITASSPTCTAEDITQFTSENPLCTASEDPVSGDTYVVVNDLVSKKQFYKIQISGIINAKAAKRVTDTKCESSVNSAFSPILDEGTVQSMQFVHNVMPTTTATYSALSSQINGDRESSYLIKVQIENPLLELGTIQVQLPKTNYHHMNHGNPNGNEFITNAYNVPRNYSVEVTFGRVGSSDETAIPLDNSDTLYPLFDWNDNYSDLLKIKLANAAKIAENQEIRVKMTYVTNPPSTNPIKTVALITGDKDFNKIDEVQSVEVATTLPNKFINDNTTDQVSNVVIKNDLPMVSAVGVEYTFTVYLTNDIPRDGKLYVSFPTDGWKLTCETTTDTLLYSVVDTSQADFLTANMGCSTVDNRLELESGWPTNSDFLYAPGPVIFTLGGFDNPETTAKKNIKVATYNSDGGLYIIDQDDAPFFLTFTSGLITVTSVSPTDNVIYSSDGTYKFSMSFQHIFKTSYTLTITLPPELIVIQNSACLVTPGANIVSLVTEEIQCAAEATSQAIIVKDIFLADLPADQVIDFEINSIQNPGDFLNIEGLLTFKLTTSTGGEVDQGEFKMGVDLYVGSYIESFEAKAMSLVAGDSPVYYKFTVVPHARVPQGTIMKLTLPPEVIIQDRTKMSQSCSNGILKGFSHDSFTCAWDQSAGTIEITNGFKYKYSDGFPPKLEWQIGFFENPRSMATTGMFNITMYDINRKSVYEYNNTWGPNLTMSEVRQPAGVTLERTSRQNGVMNNYTFQLKSNNYIEDGDILKFSIPSPVRFTDSSECWGVSYWMSGNLTCTKSGDRQTVYVTAKANNRRQLSLFEEANSAYTNHIRKLAVANIPAGNKIDITFTNITSPYSLRPVNGSVIYSLTTAEGYTIETFSDDLNIKNEFLGSIDVTTAGVSPDYFERNKTANYTFSFSPLNYEQNMQIIIYVPKTIEIPRRVNCTGLAGVDKPEISCTVNRYRNKIILTDSLTEQTIRPKQIEWRISIMRNPEQNILTKSFKIYTETYDGYGIDRITKGMKINFVCIFPCKLCNEDIPTECYACYTATTPYIYLFNSECLETCPDGMYEVPANATHTSTCDYCQWPCLTCGTSAVQCLTCPERYLLYDVESTCYEEIIYYFPFLCAAGFFFIVVLLVDCCKTSTNFTHSLLYFLCYLEIGVHGFLGYLWWINRDGLQKTDRSFSMVSYIMQVFLNTVFAGVHCGIILPNASPQYKQVFKEYKCTSWIVQFLAYILSFKMSLMLVSSFAALPRFSGTFNNDSWQKFNLFSVFYILLCYLVFVADFYLYFTSNGLRKLTSYVAAEAVIIMTMISLILMFEILSQCACAGMNEQDLGRRAGLNMSKKNGAKKKRRALRSGMGNEEDSYGDEYDSEGSYFSEIEFPEEEVIKKVTPIPESEEDEYGEYGDYDEEEEDEEVTAGAPDIKKSKKVKVTQGKDPGLDMLEDLAKQMAEEKARLKSEREQILEEKERLLKEKEENLKNAGSLQENMNKERDRIKRELQEDQGDILEEVDERIENRLKQRDINIFLKKKGPSIVIPEPVSSLVFKEKEIDGDEEYWLQNATAIQEDVSNVSAVREKDASVIEFVQNESAQKSMINSMREMEDEQEMRANISAGPVMKDDISAGRSMHATEQNYINRESAVFRQENGSRERQTEQDYFEGASAVFSQIPDNVSKNATEQNFINRSLPDFGNVSNNTRVREGQEIQDVGRRSAEFGDVSNINKSASEIEALNRTPADMDKVTNNTRALDGQTQENVLNATPVVDNEGHSEESDEGVVADHKPFDGIREAIANQEQYRQNVPEQQFTPDEVQNSQDDEDNRPSARRRIKQVLYSDKSESSVDDMMEDTPSNYNIANGRLEGKSMGLKAILLFAKNQGIQLGAQPGKGGQLPQIAEEAQQLNKSGEGNNWKPMNMPINTGRTQLVGEDVNRTMEADGSGMRQSKNTRSKRNPGVTKEFKEGPNEMGNLSGRNNSNNLKNIQKNNYV